MRQGRFHRDFLATSTRSRCGSFDGYTSATRDCSSESQYCMQEVRELQLSSAIHPQLETSAWLSWKPQGPPSFRLQGSARHDVTSGRPQRGFSTSRKLRVIFLGTSYGSHGAWTWIRTRLCSLLRSPSSPLNLQGAV